MLDVRDDGCQGERRQWLGEALVRRWGTGYFLFLKLDGGYWLCSLWDNLLSCILRIGTLFFMSGIFQSKDWKKETKKINCQTKLITTLTKQLVNPKLASSSRPGFPVASSNTGMACDAGCWLGPQRGLSSRTPTVVLSVWSGTSHSMVAKFQKRKWRKNQPTLWPSLSHFHCILLVKSECCKAACAQREGN